MTGCVGAGYAFPVGAMDAEDDTIVAEDPGGPCREASCRGSCVLRGSAWTGWQAWW